MKEIETIMNDAEISAQAKGVFVHLAMMNDNSWEGLEELTNHFSNGKTAITSAFNELLEKGYVRRNRVKNENGTFYSVELELIPNKDGIITKIL